MERSGPREDEIDLRGVASLEEVARRVKERLDATPGDSWITGRNWDQSLWPGGAFPTAAVLDAVGARTGRSGSIALTATPAGPTPRPCGEPRSRRTRRPRSDGQILRD